ncbi:MAG: hypothetical protein ACOY3Y_02170 [Acidobacteriota bacterium]
MDTSTRGVRVSVLAALSVAFGVGQAVQASNGNLDPGAIRWLSFAVVMGVGLLAFGARVVRSSWGEQLLLGVGGAAVCWQFAQLFSTPPGIYLRLPNVQALFTFYGGLAAAAVLVGAGLSESPWLGRWRSVLLVGLFLLVGRWMLNASPSPHIDVFVFQRDGAAALLQGVNPYSLRYPDIYGNSPFYGPGLSVNGQLQFGFPYFPLGLLLTLPAHALAGDYRWTQLIAMAMTGLVIMELRPSVLSRLAGAVFLFSPRTFFVLEQGWTEPLVLGALSLLVVVAERWPRWLPYALGLLIAVKQYTVFMVPLAFLLLPRPLTWRGAATFAAKAAAPALLVTLPFVAWGPRDFWFDVVQLQVLQPFRDEALSFLAWWKQQHGVQPSTAWPFVAAIAAVALSVWRFSRTIGGFVGALSVTYLVFFATNKQAFCNYYYLVIGAAALSAALFQGEKDTASRAPSAAA